MTPKDNISGLSVDFGDELSKNLTIHKNFKQEIIITTEDKIKLVLINTKEILSAQRDWLTPLGLLLSFVATLVTADFKNILGVTKEFWNAIFVILTLVSSIWLVKALYNLYKNWNQDNLENIIEKIKLKNSDHDESEKGDRIQQKTLNKIPISNNWNINHWKNNYARIENGEMIFEGNAAKEKQDGSHIDLKGILEIGKTYEISCFAKSAPNTDAMFQLWLHDNAGSSSYGIDVKTEFKTPLNEGEIIKLQFIPKFNRDIRIHLQYSPGIGQIKVSQVYMTEFDNTV